MSASRYPSIAARGRPCACCPVRMHPLDHRPRTLVKCNRIHRVALYRFMCANDILQLHRQLGRVRYVDKPSLNSRMRVHEIPTTTSSSTRVELGAHDGAKMLQTDRRLATNTSTSQVARPPSASLPTLSRLTASAPSPVLSTPPSSTLSVVSATRSSTSPLLSSLPMLL